MSGGFYSVHPLPALIYYAGAILLIFLFDHPLFLVTSCLSALLIWRLVDPHSEKRRFLISYLFMASMVIILNPLFNHRGATILFYLFDQHITLEATVYGLLMGVILLSVFITFQSFNRILSADKMIYLFVPVLPRSTLVLRLAMRNVPLLLRRLKHIMLVQRTLGHSLTTGSLRQRVGIGLLYLAILLSWSLEEAVIAARSMRARGFGMGRRTMYVRHVLRRNDVYLLVLLVLLGLLLYGAWLFGTVQYTIYPALSSLQLSTYGWLIYGCYTFYFLIPIFIEIKEYYRWRV